MCLKVLNSTIDTAVYAYVDVLNRQVHVHYSQRANWHNKNRRRRHGGVHNLTILHYPQPLSQTAVTTVQHTRPPLLSEQSNSSASRGGREGVSAGPEGVSWIFHWGPRPKGRKPRAGGGGEVGFLGRGSNPLPIPRESAEALWTPQRGSGRNLDRPKVFHYFQHSGWHLRTL